MSNTEKSRKGFVESVANSVESFLIGIASNCENNVDVMRHDRSIPKRDESVELNPWDGSKPVHNKDGESNNDSIAPEYESDVDKNDKVPPESRRIIEDYSDNSNDSEDDQSDSQSISVENSFDSDSLVSFETEGSNFDESRAPKHSTTIKKQHRILDIFKVKGKNWGRKEGTSTEETRSNSNTSSPDHWYSDWSSGGTLSVLENRSICSFSTAASWYSADETRSTVDERSLGHSIFSEDTTNYTINTGTDSIYTCSTIESNYENKDLQKSSKNDEDSLRTASEKIADETLKKVFNAKKSDSDLVRLKKKTFSKAAFSVVSIIEAIVKSGGSMQHAELSVKAVLVSELNKIYTSKETVEKNSEEMSNEIFETGLRLISAEMKNEDMRNIMMKQIASWDNLLRSS